MPDPFCVIIKNVLFLFQTQQCNKNPDYQFLMINNTALRRTEIKLLFVPVVFFILRIWDLIDSMFYVYCKCPPQNVHWLQILTVSVSM